MEDGLRVKIVKASVIFAGVLILVLMEDGLRDERNNIRFDDNVS